MADIYLMTIEEAAKLPEELCRGCFPRRFEASRRFLHREDRLRSVGAGALLSLVTGVSEERLIRDGNGKLHIDGGKAELSLSHSGSFTALATGDSALGVDIELIKPQHMCVAERVYTLEELRWLEEGGAVAAPLPGSVRTVTAEDLITCLSDGLPGSAFSQPAQARFTPVAPETSRETRFFTLWTMKESLLKADGIGLFMDPRELNVMPFLQGGSVSFNNKGWSCGTMCFEGHCLSLCY